MLVSPISLIDLLMEPRNQVGDLGTLFPAFQPIVPMFWTGERDIIYEVLARIRTPEGVVLNPGEFLGRYASHLDIDLPMLQFIPTIQQRTGRILSINAAPSSLCTDSYYKLLIGLLASREIYPHRFILEVIEDSDEPSVCDINLWSRLDEIRSLGARIALDDFGSGGNGIAMLSAGHFDIVKLCKSLDVTSDRGRVIAEQMVEMVSRLSSIGDGTMTLVVEGIETARHLHEANRMGANYGQGFLICPPTDSLVRPERLIARVMDGLAENVDSKY